MNRIYINFRCNRAYHHSKNGAQAFLQGTAVVNPSLVVVKLQLPAGHDSQLYRH